MSLEVIKGEIGLWWKGETFVQKLERVIWTKFGSFEREDRVSNRV